MIKLPVAQVLYLIGFIESIPSKMSKRAPRGRFELPRPLRITSFQYRIPGLRLTTRLPRHDYDFLAHSLGYVPGAMTTLEVLATIPEEDFIISSLAMTATVTATASLFRV